MANVLQKLKAIMVETPLAEDELVAQFNLLSKVIEGGALGLDISIVQTQCSVAFFCENETVRASALRCARCTLDGEPAVVAFMALPRLEVAIVRNLEMRNETQDPAPTQRTRVQIPPPAVIQALLLVRKILQVAPRKVPLGVMASLVALTEGWNEPAAGGRTVRVHDPAAPMAAELLALAARTAPAVHPLPPHRNPPPPYPHPHTHPHPPLEACVTCHVYTVLFQARVAARAARALSCALYLKLYPTSFFASYHFIRCINWHVHCTLSAAAG